MPGSLEFTEHESRRLVVDEMHLRRWPHLKAPCEVLQFVRMVELGERDREQECLHALPAGATCRTRHARHMTGAFGNEMTFTWERHSEASTMTLFLSERPGVEGGPEAGDVVPLGGLQWARGLPGKVIRATRIVIVGCEEAAQTTLGELAFDESQLVSCYIGGRGSLGGARIWSDFRIRPEGLGLALVSANDLGPADLARVVQRFQELGNYRNLALLGLPVSQAGWRELDELEDKLNALTAAICDEGMTDDALLAEITRISIALTLRGSADDWRMDATEAYARIVDDRLSDLAVQPIAGFLSLSDFTQRRFVPAVRTCASHRRRTHMLALRAEQFVALFRSRIDTRMENQNARLLASMERNTVRQLRLQQLVEGLSVVALSYYAIGLVSHVIEGFEALEPGLHARVLTAILTPLILALVWYGIHRAKLRRLEG